MVARPPHKQDFSKVSNPYGWFIQPIQRDIRPNFDEILTGLKLIAETSLIAAADCINDHYSSDEVEEVRIRAVHDPALSRIMTKADEIRQQPRPVFNFRL